MHNDTIFEIIKIAPESREALILINELSDKLFKITGDTGKSSFNHQDCYAPNAAFIILRVNGENLACGAIRPISADTCEIKRMYSKVSGKGFGKRVLKELEKLALEYGYQEIWLSTRKINKSAVNFYLKNGYAVRAGYGKYRHSTKSICFFKKIAV